MLTVGDIYHGNEGQDDFVPLMDDEIEVCRVSRNTHQFNQPESNESLLMRARSLALKIKHAPSVHVFTVCRFEDQDGNEIPFEDCNLVAGVLDNVGLYFPAKPNQFAEEPKPGDQFEYTKRGVVMTPLKEWGVVLKE